MIAHQSPVQISVEQRFPLDLRKSSDPVGELYEAAKAEHWLPGSALPWEGFDASRHDPVALTAARRVWSRRAWIEYSGLSATPALVIRFCLERDREIDPKFFLTVRNTEEAWHVESFHRYAELCGGYIESPQNPAWEALFNAGLYRDALDANYALDAYVVTHCAFVDSLELQLMRRWLEGTHEPLARSLIEHCIADGERHARFGWLYAERRLALADDAQRAAIASALRTHIEKVEFAGYRCVGLATEIDASADADDLRRVADAGLGAVTAQDEIGVFLNCVRETRERLAGMGVDLPVLNHARIGSV